MPADRCISIFSIFCHLSSFGATSIMSDDWSEIQAMKSRQSNLRAKMLARRKEREGLVASITNTTLSKSESAPNISEQTKIEPGASSASIKTESSPTKQTAVSPSKTTETVTIKSEKADTEVEKKVLLVLCDISLDIPCNALKISELTSKMLGRNVKVKIIEDLLMKFASQQLISDEHNDVEEPPSKISKKSKQDSLDLESLLSSQTAKEKENMKVLEEIQELLTMPTAKEQILTERFKSQGGAQLQEFCQYGTKEECTKLSPEKCDKLHFRKIIHKHTDESLGDCSFLNTCFHMDTCKWIQCDMRYFDMSVLGKCAVIMADPPWDIHMELPYGTMSDDEMRKLPVPVLQDDGYIFLWVTGRAMELGRECLDLWGYKRIDELIWVKTNQLQRIIRTGRTGHWLNHGKEHCLVGAKGNLKGVNKGLDCDVIVAEVRATSHKPDEVYGIIERLSPGTRKVELFGRPHNVQPNWITLGNQLEGVRLKDPDIVQRFREKFPDGNCMGPPKQNG
ncbi:hypothetical protein KUTeg_020001 [Tegillarca granosa]|uniref:mRNA m(6)A methyltransferase n=1 Tax=Tegillarca granosa TaxID=220873 RepID=A0ABQ9EEL3_TEGGR|nr:hypothetical protein KUTeg_020001 [Tegillarca granosa]